MIELTRRGMPRQDAHEIIRESSMEALDQRKPLAKILSTKQDVIMYISEDECENLLDPHAYIGLAAIQVDNLIRKLVTKYVL
jgi:adenylosuccinate lyase